jgi:hypothetical protein
MSEVPLLQAVSYKQSVGSSDDAKVRIREHHLPLTQQDILEPSSPHTGLSLPPSLPPTPSLPRTPSFPRTPSLPRSPSERVVPSKRQPLQIAVPNTLFPRFPLLSLPSFSSNVYFGNHSNGRGLSPCKCEPEGCPALPPASLAPPRPSASQPPSLPPASSCR